MRRHMTYRRWRQGIPLIKGVFLIVSGFLVLSLGAAGLPKFSLPPVAVSVFASEEGVSGQGFLKRILSDHKINFVHILSEGLPLSHRRQLLEDNPKPRVRPTWSLLTDGPGKLKVVLEPLGLVQSELGWFELAARGSYRPQKSNGLEEITPADTEPSPTPVVSPAAEPLEPVLKPEGPPRVAIYHTHTSEDYIPTAGVSHTYGQEAGIVVVGRELAKVLEEKHGISCLHNTTVHDAPVYREAYLRSNETVAKLLKDNPQLEVILDIHRDAPTKDAAKSRDMTTTTINGQKVARIYIVVGTDRLGLSHPNWGENHAFAKELQRHLETSYPGLSRGIKIDTARFNQHLHPHLILIEIGGDQNTLDEAKKAAVYLADVLAAWFRNQE